MGVASCEVTVAHGGLCFPDSVDMRQQGPSGHGWYVYPMRKLILDTAVAKAGPPLPRPNGNSSLSYDISAACPSEIMKANAWSTSDTDTNPSPSHTGIVHSLRCLSSCITVCISGVLFTTSTRQ